MKQRLTKGDRVPFTQVANELIESPDLSLKAKGLWAYLYSRPDDWQFSSERVAEALREGRKSILTGLKELEQYGFLRRTRHGDGRVDYEIFWNPKSENGTLDIEPKSQKGTVPSRHGAKKGSISNKESIQTKELVATENVCDTNALIEGFKEVNPSYTRLYANRTQRAAIERMVKAHGCDKMQRTIGYLKISNGKPFAPVITTPLELERNLGRLVAFSRREKQSAVGIVL